MLSWTTATLNRLGALHCVHGCRPRFRVQPVWRFELSKSVGYLGTNINVGWQRLEVCVRSISTVVNLHQLMEQLLL